MDHNQLIMQEANPAAAPQPRNLFTSLPQQLDQIRKWNEERRWGLRAADFDSVDLTPPAERRPLVVDLIAVYLDGSSELSGVRRTCHELWTVAAEQYAYTWCWDWYWDKWKNRPKPVRLIDGITHRPGIRRVTVDLGAHFTPNRYVRANHVRGPDSAHAEVLAAAALFPRWVRAMDGRTVPYTWVSGYEVMIRERPSPERQLALSWSKFRRHLSLTADWGDHAHIGWASPTCTG